MPGEWQLRTVEGAHPKLHVEAVIARVVRWLLVIVGALSVARRTREGAGRIKAPAAGCEGSRIIGETAPGETLPERA
jgi:hypothetical protein